MKLNRKISAPHVPSANSTFVVTGMKAKGKRKIKIQEKEKRKKKSRIKQEVRLGPEFGV